MCRKLIYVVCFVLVLAGSTKLQAQELVPFFSDDFNTPHNYLSQGLGNYDGMVGQGPNETVVELNADMNHPGQLYLEAAGNWNASPAGSNTVPVGPFLYKVVEGDFIATVKVTDYAGTEEESVFHNTAGLQVRIPPDPNENWVAIDYFPIWGCGNFVREFNDGAGGDVPPHNGLAWDLDPYLQLERSGNRIILRTSPDGEPNSWVEMLAASPRTRNDFVGLPLQVGLRQCTFDQTVVGYAAFDNFKIDHVIMYKAYSPSPVDEAVNVDPNADPSWSPGAEVKFHDVYFGTDETEVTDANSSDPCGPGEIYRGRQSGSTYEPGTMEYGTTYYWRIDEVNDPNFWPGDVWSFTITALTASQPSPPDYGECVLRDSDLAWTPGVIATFHDIYFGTVSPPPLVKSFHTLPYYVLPTLEYGTTYYWQINAKRFIAGWVVWPGEEWEFTTVHQIPIDPCEPNLVGWWKLDATSCGNIALDSSGYDQHGTPNGPQWVEGYDGLSLGFDGIDDYVELPIGPLISSLTNSTFMIWMNSTIGGSNVRTFDFSRADDPNFYMCLGPREWFMDEMYLAITTTDNVTQYRVVTTGFDLPSNEWHHVAVTINADANEAILYYDGEELARNESGFLNCPNDLGVTTNNWLGRSHDDADSYYLGSMYDFRIYDRVLTQEELWPIMWPKRAWQPSPADDATDVNKTPTLSWWPGKYADKHDVYFGTDETAVTDANRTNDPCNVLVSENQDANTYVPGTLEFDTEYFWRIDEVNEAGPDPNIWPGAVWSFTTANYLIVENFDSYAANEDLWDVWMDRYTGGVNAYLWLRNGATFPELVRDGNSMEYIYHDEESPYYSEGYADIADLPSQIGSDWTSGGVKALVLYFYGQAYHSPSERGNDANEPMYVRLHDTDSNAVVTYGDYYDEDPNDLRVEEWHQWNIDLEDFNSAGVDLTNVTRITIGFGDGINPSPASGQGTVYFEDIRLYPSRCVPGRAPGDFDNDCDVDYDDLDIIANNWLISDYNVTPVNPGDPCSDPNLVAWYDFEGDFNDFNDSSGNGNHGDPCGTAVTGDSGDPCRGLVAIFDGNSYVELPIGYDINSMTNSTFMTWADSSNRGGGWQRIFDFGTDQLTTYMFLTPRMDTDGAMRFAITAGGAGAAEEIVDAPDTLASGWHHVAVTFVADNNNSTISLYLDGLVVGRNTDATLTPSDLGNTPNNWLGKSQFAVDANYIGSLDDFRIYDRALSDGEVAWIAGLRDGFTQPLYLLLTPANRYINVYYDDNTINFKDYAAMMNWWLEERPWP